MVDTRTPEQRSALMSRVRGKNTKPELIVRKLLWSMGYRYRLYDRNLPGVPDLVFKGRRKVVFVHGCFWHAHGCSKGQPPKSRLDYWIPKLQQNAERDRKKIKQLELLGWKVLVVWQCETKDIGKLSKRLEAFLDEPNKAIDMRS